MLNVKKYYNRIDEKVSKLTIYTYNSTIIIGLSPKIIMKKGENL